VVSKTERMSRDKLASGAGLYIVTKGFLTFAAWASHLSGCRGVRSLTADSRREARMQAIVWATRFPRNWVLLRQLEQLAVFLAGVGLRVILLSLVSLRQLQFFMKSLQFDRYRIWSV